MRGISRQENTTGIAGNANEIKMVTRNCGMTRRTRISQQVDYSFAECNFI